MTNCELLKHVIDISGLKLGAICAALNMTYFTLRSRLSGKTEFTVPEIMALSKILQLSPTLREQIFFAQKVE